MSSRLESLPNELIHHIFDTIEASESYECQYQKTFVNLSLTSKRCRSIATRFVFNQLIFRTVSFEQLKEKLTDCAQTLARSGCINDVQSFHITVQYFKHHGAREGTRIAQLIKEFPNIKGILVQFSVSPAYFGDVYGFSQSVNRVLGAGCVGSEYMAGKCFCWWYE